MGRRVARPAALDLGAAFPDRLQEDGCRSATDASDAWVAARPVVMAVDPELEPLDAVSEKWAALAPVVPVLALELPVQPLRVSLELCKPGVGQFAEQSFAAVESASAPEPLV